MTGLRELLERSFALNKRSRAFVCRFDACEKLCGRKSFVCRRAASFDCVSQHACELVSAVDFSEVCGECIAELFLCFVEHALAQHFQDLCDLLASLFLNSKVCGFRLLIKALNHLAELAVGLFELATIHAVHDKAI